MRAIRIFGVILILLGILGFIFPRITFTEAVPILGIGPLQVQAEQERSVAIPDIAAGAAVIAGIALVIAGARSR